MFKIDTWKYRNMATSAAILCLAVHVTDILNKANICDKSVQIQT